MYLLVCSLHVHWHTSKNNAAPFLRWPTAFGTLLYRNRFIFSTLPDNEMKFGMSINHTSRKTRVHQD